MPIKMDLRWGRLNSWAGVRNGGWWVLAINVVDRDRLAEVYYPTAIIHDRMIGSWNPIRIRRII